MSKRKTVFSKGDDEKCVPAYMRVLPEHMYQVGQTYPIDARTPSIRKDAIDVKNIIECSDGPLFVVHVMNGYENERKQIKGTSVKIEREVMLSERHTLLTGWKEDSFLYRGLLVAKYETKDHQHTLRLYCSPIFPKSETKECIIRFDTTVMTSKTDDMMVTGEFASKIHQFPNLDEDHQKNQEKLAKHFKQVLSSFTGWISRYQNKYEIYFFKGHIVAMFRVDYSIKGNDSIDVCRIFCYVPVSAEWWQDWVYTNSNKCFGFLMNSAQWKALVAEIESIVAEIENKAANIAL